MTAAERLSPLPSLCVAAAQSVSLPGDIAGNVAQHLAFIAAAAQARVDVLLFPELSLSGYELPLLQQCAVHPDGTRLAPIQQQAMAHGMVVVVGAPLVSDSVRPYIGAIAYFPDGGMSVYGKQHLHGDEVVYASPGAPVSVALPVGQDRFALAICADIAHAQHAQAGAATGAGLYLASVLVSKQGYSVDAAYLAQYASLYPWGVLMANHGAPSGGYASAGRSAFWAPGGRLVVSAAGTGPCLVVATRGPEGWSGACIDLAV